MKLLRKINAALGSATGFQVRRAGPRIVARPAVTQRPPGTRGAIEPRPPADPAVDRLLRRPVFVIAPVRSGSTLLRLTLNAHSRLHAPHELHFRRLEVAHATRLADRSLSLLGLDRTELEHLLWDRVLHRELVRSGKQTLVEKTPGNAFVFRRIAACWPDARFLFLLRHPAAVARSWHEADPVKRNPEHAAHDALRYLNAVERARRALPGHTVRYEELTAEPETALRAVCDFLEVDFEPGMVEYGRAPGGTAGLEKGLGDWREKVRSGRVQPGRELPPPEAVPAVLREICETWGYAEAEPAAGRLVPSGRSS